jgi:hypothetical protein
MIAFLKEIAPALTLATLAEVVALLLIFGPWVVLL